jgi:hypothetical protein
MSKWNQVISPSKPDTVNRAGGEALKLVDAVNLLHPRHTEALKALMAGTLKSADTWESAISAAASMRCAINSRSFGATPVPIMASDVGAIFAAALGKKGADVMTFHDRAAYDRIIILSDMQAWVGHATPADAFKRYCQKHRCNPHVYCFNLVSYGDTQFPASKVYQLAGFSDKVFDTMALLETDRLALVKEIKAIELGKK